MPEVSAVGSGPRRKSANWTFLQDFSIELIREFRAGWNDGPRAAGKKLERLRGFFRFCQEDQWIESNPEGTEGSRR